jgi:Sel1 repeat
MEEIARTGDVRAEAWMGLMLQNGSRREESKVWWRKAADKGNLWAISVLGRMLIADKQDEEAAYWYRRGAEIGDTSSQETYASLLLVGRGVAKDERAAARWLSAAAGQRSRYAYLPRAELYAEGRGVERDPVEAYALAAIAEAVLDGSDFEPERQAGELKTRLAEELSPKSIRAALLHANVRRPDLGDVATAKARRESSKETFLLIVLTVVLGAVAIIGVFMWRIIRTLIGAR